MVSNTLIELFTRELQKLKTEISSYSEVSNLWLTADSISNSGGNLALHLVGNLNHFIGAELGKTGYVRQRELEFSEKNIPVSDISKQIDDTIDVIENALRGLSDKDLQEEYRRNPFEGFMTSEYFLMHLLTHLSYHLGQINYHRRLLDI